MDEKVVRLGLMPPLTGLVGIYGSEIVHAAQIACQEVNENGGVLGKPLELVIEDDGSLPESAVSAAEKLVIQHRCTAIIGNLLSNSRIAVAYRVAEPHKVPLLNFSFYEGSILSRYFFHFAALPNQQIEQMIPYMANRYGKKMFFAGNNYEWPRGSIHAAKLALDKIDGEVLGEEYCSIGVELDVIDSLLDRVEAANPDVFVPYFAGADQVLLLTRFTERGLKKHIAVVMGHYDEMMASQLSPEVREGFYSSNTYFMSVESEENRKYLESLENLPDVNGIWPQGNGILTNFGEGTYACVKAFAKAANKAGSIEPEALMEALKSIEFSAPQGILKMNPEHQHATVNTYLSCCQKNGDFKVIESFGVIEPEIPDRYKHQRIAHQATLEDDIRLQARMLEQMTEAVLLISTLDGSIIYTNAGADRLFGYNKEEMIGLPVTQINNPHVKDAQRTANKIIDVLNQTGNWEGEIQNIKKDGTPLWSHATVSTFTHPVYGEVWLAVHHDITENKRAEILLAESEERIRLINSRVPGIVYQFKVDAEGNRSLPYVSPTVKKYLGITAEAVMEDAEKWFGLTHPDDLPSLEKTIVQSMKNLMLWEWEGRFVCCNGETVWLRGTSTPVKNTDGSIVWDGVFVDITDRIKTQEALRDSEALLAKAQSLTGIGHWKLNPMTNEVAGSDELFHIFGISRDDATLDTFIDIVHPDDRAMDVAAIQRGLEYGENWDIEHRLLCGDGEIKWVHALGEVITDKTGKIIALIGTIQDISLRKQNEADLSKHRNHLEELVREGSIELYEREQQLKNAQRIARMGNYEWDLKNNNLSWSDTIYDLFGIEVGSVQPTLELFLEKIHPEDVNSIKQIMDEALSCTYPVNKEKRVTLPTLEYRSINTKGSVFWLRAEGAATLDKGGHPILIHGTVQDISTHKLAEQEITAAKEEAERANSAKSNFLSSMSHELRTPMNAILGFAQLLKLDKDQFDDNQRESVNEILFAGKHLLELINEVLDLSKIESGSLDINIRNTDVDTIMRSSIKLIEPQVSSNNLELIDNVSGKGYIVRADLTRLKQILLNLLSNAIKYNKDRGKITVDSKITDQQRLRITISDTGDGISEEDMTKIFTPFQRFNEDENIEGTGIGLVITKRLVELMGGVIGVESEIGKGSSFWFELKLSRKT